MRLEGKVALITGAATGDRNALMGIGGATAWLFAREGARAVVTDINDALGKRTVQQMREDGHDATYIHLDVTRESEWEQAVQAAVATYGRLDILVNCAGDAAGSEFPVEGTTRQAWDRMMDINAKGTFLGMKHAIPHMKTNGGGAIVNVSSMHGIVGTFTVTAYQAAKGAVRILSKAAAIQYARDNVRVNSIHPGFTITPLTAPMFTRPDIHADRVAGVPMGRMARAEEIAAAILFLASDESSYVTGSELVVDGGVIAQ
ncbi:MAG: SDR family oxidoreductase [SAR202 cluster bacterium]|nr:SDR family oxidoreductase [SAR202 cluster bacterium]